MTPEQRAHANKIAAMTFPDGGDLVEAKVLLSVALKRIEMLETLKANSENSYVRAVKNLGDSQRELFAARAVLHKLRNDSTGGIDGHESAPCSECRETWPSTHDGPCDNAPCACVMCTALRAFFVEYPDDQTSPADSDSETGRSSQSK